MRLAWYYFGVVRLVEFNAISAEVKDDGMAIELPADPPADLEIVDDTVSISLPPTMVIEIDETKSSPDLIAG